MLKGQLRTSDLLLTQVYVFSELGNCIQWGVVLKTQPTDLQNVKSNQKENQSQKAYSFLHEKI